MVSVPVEEAQSRLAEIIAGLHPGDELLITRQGNIVARLIASSDPPCAARQPGSAIGQLTIIAEDDDHLADFGEYLSSCN